MKTDYFTVRIMEGKYKFSIVSKEDVHELSPLIHRCYRGKNLGGWTTESDFLGGIRTNPEMLLKQLEDNSMTMIKAVDSISGKIVGCVNCQLHASKSTLHTGMLCVDPSIQAQGLGKFLMKQVDDFALNNSCTSIILDVITIRKELSAWYERRGFRFTGKITPFSAYGVGDPTTQDLEFGEMIKHL